MGEGGFATGEVIVPVTANRLALSGVANALMDVKGVWQESVVRNRDSVALRTATGLRLSDLAAGVRIGGSSLTSRRVRSPPETFDARDGCMFAMVAVVLTCQISWSWTLSYTY